MKALRDIAALTALALLIGQAIAASTFKPVRPPAVPLAVRSPYLNVWLNGVEDGNSSGYLAGRWPQSWSQVTQGWQGLIMVDGKPFNWMGASGAAPVVDQQSLEYTSTRSAFTANVDGKVQMIIKFTSPVYYDDLRRQAITSSYLEVAVRTLDSQPHNVQLYCDVSGEWASGDTNAVIEWKTDSHESVRYHKFYRRDQAPFTEVREIASWGDWYWATAEKTGVSYQIGGDKAVRGQFISQGRLTGNVDQDFRAINQDWPVFALARDLGAVGGDWSSILFTIGYAQDDAINFQGKEEQPRHIPSLWKAWFSELDTVSFFYNDYDHASQYCDKLDVRIAQASSAAASPEYATITALSVRQVFGALAFTNTEQSPLVFLKEISSNSDIQTVDVIFPAFPLLVYLNPNLIKWVLDPLLENDATRYPNSYAQHDLGTFPNALGHPKGDDEAMPLEECGNMIIMMLLYAQRTGDNGYLTASWDLLQKWAQYLVEEAKIPAQQLSTDDFAGHLANQTNLAIKGIIGLKATSQIAYRIGGHVDEVEKFDKLASDYLTFWLQHAINNDAQPKHTMLQYDNTSTYGLLYNIYADKVLGLNLLPESLYDMQSDFYLSTAKQFGVALDTRGTLTKLDWELFAAAVAKPATRDMFVKKIADWIGRTNTTRALTDLYDTEDGYYPRDIQFTARPVVGGAFAILALTPS